jgi:hypothetical protein
MFFFHFPKNPRLWFTTLSRGLPVFVWSGGPTGTLSKVRLVWLSPWKPTLFPVGLGFASCTLKKVSYLPVWLSLAVAHPTVLRGQRQ